MKDYDHNQENFSAACGMEPEEVAAIISKACIFVMKQNVMSQVVSILEEKIIDDPGYRRVAAMALAEKASDYCTKTLVRMYPVTEVKQ